MPYGEIKTNAMRVVFITCFLYVERVEVNAKNELKLCSPEIYNKEMLGAQASEI